MLIDNDVLPVYVGLPTLQNQCYQTNLSAIYFFVSVCFYHVPLFMYLLNTLVLFRLEGKGLYPFGLHFTLRPVPKSSSQLTVKYTLIIEAPASRSFFIRHDSLLLAGHMPRNPD